MNFLLKNRVVVYTFISILVQMLFSNAIKETSDKFTYGFTPAGWYFSFWFIIYAILIYEAIKSRTDYYRQFILCYINSFLMIWPIYWTRESFFSSSAVIFAMLIIINSYVENNKYDKSFAIITAWLTLAFIQNALVAISAFSGLVFTKDIAFSLIFLSIFTYKGKSVLYTAVVIYAITGIYFNGI